MDEEDINIKKILDGYGDEQVPFGFNDGIMKKIEARQIKIHEKRETLNQILIASLLGILCFAVLFFLNFRYFKIDFAIVAKSIFRQYVSIIWVIIGANLAILLILESMISTRINDKNQT